MSRKRPRKLVEQTKKEPRDAAGSGKVKTVAQWLIGIVVAASVPLYIARPDIQPKTVWIDCAICDRSDQIHPPDTLAEANTGATITVAVENTGSMGTTLTDHNLTLRTKPEAIPFTDSDFSEVPDSNDNIQAYIGAHAQVKFAASRNELTVYAMRHGVPMGSSLAPVTRDAAYLYGHLTYRTSFYLPVTRSFCFKYSPPTKGLPESWGVCPSEILAKVVTAKSRK